MKQILTLITLLSTGYLLAQSPVNKQLQSLRDAKVVSVPVKHVAKVHLPFKNICVLWDSNSESKEAAKEIQNLLAGSKRFNVTTRDPEDLKAIVEELDFSNSGLVPEEESLKLGHFLQAEAILMVSVTAGKQEQKKMSYGKMLGIDLKSITLECSTRANVKLTHLETSKVMYGKAMTTRVSETNYPSMTGKVQPPSPSHVWEKTFEQTAANIAHLFIPWTENKEIIYFTKKALDMSKAFHKLQMGLVDDAEKLAEESYQQAISEGGKVKTSIRAQACHNRAMIYILRSKLQKALDCLQKAESFKPNKKRRMLFASLRQQMRDEANTEPLPAPKAKPQRMSTPPEEVAETLSSTTQEISQTIDKVTEQRRHKLEQLFNSGLITKQEYDLLTAITRKKIGN